MDIQAAVELFANSGNSLGLSGHLGGTDARAAFEQAYNYLKQAIVSEKFKDSFPSKLFHLTDGESQSLISTQKCSHKCSTTFAGVNDRGMISCNSLNCKEICNGAEGGRTLDLLHAMQVFDKVKITLN